MGKIVQKTFKKKSNQKAKTPSEPETEVILFSTDLRGKECTFTVDNATFNVEALEILTGEEKQATKNPQLPLNKSAQTHFEAQTLLVTTTIIEEGFYTGVDLSRIEDGIIHYFLGATKEAFYRCGVDKAIQNHTIIVPFGKVFIGEGGFWLWENGCL